MDFTLCISSFGHAEGDKIALKKYDEMSNDGIPVYKILALVWNDPNVNQIYSKK